ncbi:4846_t:CDS:1, partial [Gigaspora margarita]
MALVIGDFALVSSYLQRANSQVLLSNALVDLEASNSNRRNGLSYNALAKLDQNIPQKQAKKNQIKDLKKNYKDLSNNKFVKKFLT